MLIEAKEILQKALSERQLSNPRYSMRAFARDLRISPQQLSNVMSGRRGFSAGVAERVTGDLQLDVRQQQLFLHSLRARFAASPSQRVVAQAKLQELTAHADSKDLELELFSSICNWYHLALLGLVRLYRGRAMNAGVFAKRLELPETEVQLALARLEKLALISRTPRGWKINQGSVVFDRGMGTESIRKFHRQLLEKATQALALQTSDERYGSSSTIPVQVKNLDRAKKLIQKFRTDFDREIAEPDQGEEIYGLTVQFFRLTQSERRSPK